jgi:uncharacterized radical SAM superfamily protein
MTDRYSLPQREELTPPQVLKFALAEHGMAVPRATRDFLRSVYGRRRIQTNDFATTRGMIVSYPQVDGEPDTLYANVPTLRYHDNFVSNTSPFSLLTEQDRLYITWGPENRQEVTFHPPAPYTEEINSNGIPISALIESHGSHRDRLMPVGGCGKRCDFCGVHNDAYRTKPVPDLVDAVGRAVRSGTSHFLISGGTPRPADFLYERIVYDTLTEHFPHELFDIMMTPDVGLLNPIELFDMGINELSINTEFGSKDTLRRYALGKSKVGVGDVRGLDAYYEFIEDAIKVFPGKVRSLILVGEALESTVNTLNGVDAIASRGGIPVLSHFVPDKETELAGLRPPTTEQAIDVFIEARKIAKHYGLHLGTNCIQCGHNTMTIPEKTKTGVFYFTDRDPKTDRPVLTPYV